MLVKPLVNILGLAPTAKRDSDVIKANCDVPDMFTDLRVFEIIGSETGDCAAQMHKNPGLPFARPFPLTGRVRDDCVSSLQNDWPHPDPNHSTIEQDHKPAQGQICKRKILRTLCSEGDTAPRMHCLFRLILPPTIIDWTRDEEHRSRHHIAKSNYQSFCVLCGMVDSREALHLRQYMIIPLTTFGPTSSTYQYKYRDLS
ncbi:hypothetical protein FHL15_006805 [Xylaria flabelliformis]|uniref:Uncharacterized protein n=1 Tax=Xylaria flabelliformis TaxID=2512241 RepID=A0A553HW80_9PEZI|nr:hypothetical protein FHL15_006805 [Xylaria flabelliformis]